MATKPRQKPSGASLRLGPDALLKMYYFMQLNREFENTILRLYQQGKVVGGAYSGYGNEATAIGSAFALEPQDYLFPMHRDIGAHFVRGQSVRNMMMQHLGRAGNLTRGRDGTGHYADPSLKIYGNISHLGAMIPVACGAALASTMRGENAVALTYIGDGGSSIGEVHEGLMMASAMKLPFVLIIENNQFAYSTPLAKQALVERLSDRAIGYGIPGITIDGTDVLEVHRVCREAFARARSGAGPTIIESVTMRMSGHAAHDNAWYVPKALLDAGKKKDPIDRFEKLLAGEGILTSAGKEAMLAEIQGLLEAEAARALALPYPAGPEAAEGVFADA